MAADDDLGSHSPRPSLLFEHGFFDIRTRMANRNIKANCLACQRLGRSNLIQAREDSSSNLLAHLKVNRTAYINIHCVFVEIRRQIYFR